MKQICPECHQPSLDAIGAGELAFPVGYGCETCGAYLTPEEFFGRVDAPETQPPSLLTRIKQRLHRG